MVSWFFKTHFNTPRSKIQDLIYVLNIASKIGYSGPGIPVTCRFASRNTTHKLLLLGKNRFVIQTHNLPNLGSEFCSRGTKSRIWAAFRKNTKSRVWADAGMRVQIHVHVSWKPSRWVAVITRRGHHLIIWQMRWSIAVAFGGKFEQHLIWAAGCLVHICSRSYIT